MTDSCSCTNNLSSFLTSWHSFLLMKMVKKSPVADRWEQRDHFCSLPNTFASTLHGFCLWPSHSEEINEWIGYYVYLKRLTGNVLLRKDVCFYSCATTLLLIRNTCPTHRAWFKIVAINHSNQHLKLHDTSHSRFLFCKTRKWFIKALTQVFFNHWLVFDHMAAKLHLLKLFGLLAKERARLYRTFHQSCLET